MTTPQQAEAAIRAHAARLAVESRPLSTLLDAVLHAPLIATRDQPPFDRVTMDGIAFASRACAAGRREFRIAGIQAAGSPPLQLPEESACLEVMTGAMLPQGCDCVVPVERIEVAEGIAHLAPDLTVTPGMNVHNRGLDCRTGTQLLAAGTRLGPPEVAVIAANGMATAQVNRMPRICVISTGDELREPGASVAAWQIYRSNAYAVLAALQRRGMAHSSHDHLPDDREILAERLQAHLNTHDVLVLSGGVSMGRFDFVPQVLAELGIERIFHKVEQRPGRPLWFGTGRGKTVYALPGNPVSTLVCLVRYVLPGLEAACSAQPAATERVALSTGTELRPTLTLFVPVKLLPDGSGRALAQLCPTQGSGDFVALVGTDGFVELPPQSTEGAADRPVELPAGSVVPFYRW
jgi:molybdopterin molybdotransferase